MKKMTPYLWLILIFSLGLVSLYFPVAFAEDFRYDSHNKRDPFLQKPKEVEIATKAVKLRLEGIAFDPGGDSLAIVNGETLREGENLNGYLLKKIAEDRAIFEKDGESLELFITQKPQTPASKK